jgi:hypothetical protein
VLCADLAGSDFGADRTHAIEGSFRGRGAALLFPYPTPFPESLPRSVAGIPVTAVLTARSSQPWSFFP